MSGQADVLIAESHLHAVWKGEEERGRRGFMEKFEVQCNMAHGKYVRSDVFPCPLKWLFPCSL